MDAIKLAEYTDKLVDLLVTYGGKVVIAVIVWFVGSFAIKHLLKALSVIFDKTELDEALEAFLHSLVGVGLKILLAIMVISLLGVETTSFVALLAAGGLAVGLALQGSLANFAGGALILFFKPFTIGDKISAAGHTGNVVAIQIFNTILKTPDNRKIIIPNGELSNGSIINMTNNKTIGVELTFGIGYEDDIDRAKDIIKSIVASHKLILENPAPVIGISELADSSVNIFTRSFVKTGDYWTVLFDLNESIKKAFDKEGISIPFPQRDVHMYNHN